MILPSIAATHGWAERVADTEVPGGGAACDGRPRVRQGRAVHTRAPPAGRSRHATKPRARCARYGDAHGVRSSAQVSAA